jgi:hypothetical protein
MYVDFDREFAYVAPPKTGSHTVQAVFTQHMAAMKVVPTEQPHRLVDKPGQFASFYWFMTIRNPFTRAVSWWRHVKRHRPQRWASKAVRARYKLLQDTTFLDACRLAWSQRSDFLSRFSIAEHYLGRGGKVHRAEHIDRYVRVENLFEDLNAVLADVGQPPLVDMPARHFYNNDGRGHWWEHYTTEAEEIVRELHARDFVVFRNYYTPSLADAVRQFKLIRSTEIAEPVDQDQGVPDLVKEGLVTTDVC